MSRNEAKEIVFCPTCETDIPNHGRKCETCGAYFEKFSAVAKPKPNKNYFAFSDKKERPKPKGDD